MDHSTINLDKLSKLPVYTLPATYSLQREPGNGCYLDAPGYPTYYTRSIYTRFGNSPRKGPEMVIKHPVTGALHVVASSTDWRNGDDWDAVHARRAARLKALYLPLPYEHPRVQIWVRELHRHFRCCYRDAERLEYGKPGTLIYPVPGYKLKPEPDDIKRPEGNEGATAEWHRWQAQRLAAEANVEHNTAEKLRAAAIATPENHLAVIHVREIYPEVPSDDAYRVFPSADHEGNWWETEAQAPTPEGCRPRNGIGAQHHQAPETWCQWCGWRAIQVPA